MSGISHESHNCYNVIILTLSPSKLYVIVKPFYSGNVTVQIAVKPSLVLAPGCFLHDMHICM